MMRKSAARYGFTLLELLTVLAILSVVTTIGVQTFGKMTSVWRDTTVRMELNAKSVNIFNAIRDDIERVASAERTGRTIQGIDRLETEKMVNRHKPEDDRIILPVFQRNRGTGPWESLSVMYSIDREGAPKLVRSQGPEDGTEPSAGVQVKGEQVVAMNITYLTHENTWEKEWTRPELPAAVRVSLSFALKNRPNEHVCREAVFPLHTK